MACQTGKALQHFPQSRPAGRLHPHQIVEQKNRKTEKQKKQKQNNLRQLSCCCVQKHQNLKLEKSEIKMAEEDGKGKEEKGKSVIVLHQFPRAKKAPSPSPYPLKLETFLRMSKIPYTSGKDYQHFIIRQIAIKLI
jgi:hypothetical protein